ncbi:CpsD/CapB family tyrosine-protein kinase [Thiocystis violacea]|uniref:CpsD/CapB family tyrosine-protein kinase n=1 Tax=Thiocystis violacea TaxID=13725 RepID=UPI001906B562|nr:CpsD/CapB family tyrosine-protein kinase [Thiocystis violacea]MBK1722137.1 exopolysaccharide biosynthesis protein [Thiocystis violacea]
MERLKQAMARARAERASIRTVTPSARHTEELGLGQKTRSKGAALRIRYTHTATMPTDAHSLRNDRIILAEGIETISEHYKVLRTQVLQRMRAKGLRTLAITSPGPGEGKTTTAINLAISLARDVNQTVLLVDLDLKRPAVAKYFGNEQALGISDYLTEGRDLADIMFNPGIERLVVLPGHQQVIHSSEILSSPRFVNLVNELKARYEDRFIFFDLPPLFASDDVITFLPYVDAAMLVVEDGKVTQAELQQAQQLLGEKSLGLALNKAQEASTSTGYY